MSWSRALSRLRRASDSSKTQAARRHRRRWRVATVPHMSRQNKVNPGMYTQRGRLTQDDAAREISKQRAVGSAAHAGSPCNVTGARLDVRGRDGDAAIATPDETAEKHPRSRAARPQGEARGEDRPPARAARRLQAKTARAAKKTAAASARARPRASEAGRRRPRRTSAKRRKSYTRPSAAHVRMTTPRKPGVVMLKHSALLIGAAAARGPGTSKLVNRRGSRRSVPRRRRPSRIARRA